MGTTQNTAAIYVRRSTFDAEAKAEAFSGSLAAQGQASIQSISNWNSPSMPSARITPT